MGTRIIKWLQLCLEADPNFQVGSLRPWVYELSNGRLFYGKPDPYSPASPTFPITNDGGVVTLPSAYSEYPTSESGQPAGTLWNNGLVVCIAGTTNPPPLGQGFPAFFWQYEWDAGGLAALGGANFPLTKPTVGSQQFWNNGGVLCVA